MFISGNNQARQIGGIEIMATDQMCKVVRCLNLQIPNTPHIATVVAWNTGFYILELGRTERQCLSRVQRILQIAKPGIDRTISEGRGLTVDDYLNVARIGYRWYAFQEVPTYSDSFTLDVIIATERRILSSQRETSSSKGPMKAVKAPAKKETLEIGARRPAKVIPASVQKARKSISQLIASGEISLANSKVTWPDIRLYFGPFDVAVITDADADTFQLISSVGRVSHTALLEELFSELPIGPVEFSYQLEPNPIVKHYGQMSLTEASNPAYLLKFIQHHVLCTLVMANVLVSRELLVTPNQEELNDFRMNRGQEYFEDVLGYRDLLKRPRNEESDKVE